jgi:ribosomal-protein-alanine N-acetyltransferase
MISAGARYRLRAMTLADISDVMAIERASFPSVWPRSAYQRELEQNNLARYIVAVERTELPRSAALPAGPRRWLARLWRRAAAAAPSGERIVGFLGVWFMVDEAHIVTVASHPQLRRTGIGELLVAEAMDLARERGAEHVTLECRVSNTPAQTLYEKYGFLRAGIRKRYYTDNGEDAVIMTTPSLTDPSFLERIETLRHQRAQ